MITFEDFVERVQFILMKNGYRADRVDELVSNGFLKMRYNQFCLDNDDSANYWIERVLDAADDCIVELDLQKITIDCPISKSQFRKYVQDLIIKLARLDNKMNIRDVKEASEDLRAIEFIDFEYDTFRHFDRVLEFDFWHGLIVHTALTVYNSFFVG